MKNLVNHELTKHWCNRFKIGIFGCLIVTINYVMLHLTISYKIFVQFSTIQILLLFSFFRIYRVLYVLCEKSIWGRVTKSHTTKLFLILTILFLWNKLQIIYIYRSIGIILNTHFLSFFRFYLNVKTFGKFFYEFILKQKRDRCIKNINPSSPISGIYGIYACRRQFQFIRFTHLMRI